MLCTSLFHGQCQTLRGSNITKSTGFSSQPVVPNDAGSSCVMFLGPQHDTASPDSGDSKPAAPRVLYVGAQFSSLGNRKYRDLVPSLSRRLLPSLELAHRDSNGSSRLSVRRAQRDSFPIQFVHGFHRGGFAYFLSTQPGGSQRGARLGRICEGDNYFRSYVEIPLECGAPGLTPDLVAGAAAVTADGGSLVVAFSPSGGGGPSQLCAFSLEDLDRAFNGTVASCYAGQGHVGPPHYRERQACEKTVSTGGGLGICVSVAGARPGKLWRHPVDLALDPGYLYPVSSHWILAMTRTAVNIEPSYGSNSSE
ncbi:hypothetical protein EGW08_017052 [Elysia chlorotica]|uniref:Sema domain-containing protein n=1 Tax=Elysia chlorotica TaxID=188477 RepID=A0A433T0W8_ELYCH|nr:hypothetical protein EGW08_017052 [Elysia chlorotica]